MCLYTRVCVCVCVCVHAPRWPYAARRPPCARVSVSALAAPPVWGADDRNDPDENADRSPDVSVAAVSPDSGRRPPASVCA